MLIIHLYNTILPIMQEVESSLKLKKSKSGRKPKLSNAQIATLFIISALDFSLSVNIIYSIIKAKEEGL
jgi:hypothetical protein